MLDSQIDVHSITLYPILRRKLRETGIDNDIISRTKDMIIDSVHALLYLRNKNGEIISTIPYDDTILKVREEIDYLLSLSHVNQYTWRSFHFAFPTQGQKVQNKHIQIDHKSSNLFNSIWRGISLYFNPGLNLGEKYMQGKYDILSPGCKEHEVLEIFLTQNYKLRKWLDTKKWYQPVDWLLFRRRTERINTTDAAAENIAEHYDFGNEFYVDLLRQGGELEEFMQYSCGIDGSLYPEINGLNLKKEPTLEAFQWNKMKIHCEKMGLQAGMRVLDVGCGWGALAKFMHDEYQVEVVGVTLSQEQYELATEKNKDCEGVRIIKADIRELPERERFDRIVSVGAFEHFRDFYDEFFKKSAEYLQEGGVMSLHTIGTSKNGEVAQFFQKYIFPGGYLPTKQEVLDAAIMCFQLKEDTKFPSFENLAEHYARTLEFWIQNLVNMKDKVIEQYGEEKYRMFLFYLMASKVSFREGYSELHQYIFQKSSD